MSGHCPIGKYRHKGCSVNECVECSIPDSVKLPGYDHKSFYFTTHGGGGVPSQGDQDTCTFVLCDSEEAKCPESGKPPRDCGDAFTHGLCRQHEKKTTDAPHTTFVRPAPVTTEAKTEEITTRATTRATTTPTTTTTEIKTTADPEFHHCKRKLTSDTPLRTIMPEQLVNCDDMFCGSMAFSCEQSSRAGLDCTGCKMCVGKSRVDCPGFKYPAPAPTTTSKTTTTTTKTTTATKTTTTIRATTSTIGKESTEHYRPAPDSTSKPAARPMSSAIKSTSVTSTSKAQQMTQQSTQREKLAVSTATISTLSSSNAITSHGEVASSRENTKNSKQFSGLTAELPNTTPRYPKYAKSQETTTNGLSLSGDSPFDFTKKTNIYLWIGGGGGVVVLIIIIIVIAVVLVKRRNRQMKRVDGENFLSLMEVSDRSSGFAQI